jgi:hypothetical protein
VHVQQTAVRTVWLFFGLGVIDLCIGARHAVGVRAELEGFDTRATGLLMSAYTWVFARFFACAHDHSTVGTCVPSPR